MARSAEDGGPYTRSNRTLWMIPFVGVGLLALLEVMAFDAVDPFVVDMLGM